MPTPTHSLLRERDEIVRQWVETIRASGELSPAVGEAGAALRQPMAALVEALDRWAAVGDDAAAAELRAAASRHAAERLERGYGPAQILEELRLLRSLVLQLALAPAARGGPAPGDLCGLVALLNEGVDLALREAVEHFVNVRELRVVALQGAAGSLRDREAFLRKVLDATPSMVFVKDADGRFVLGNEALARAYGTTIPDLVGRTDADFNADAEQVAAFRRDDREVMATRREKHIPEEPVSTAGGERRWFSTVKVPLVGDDGACDHVLGVATDITDRKRAEEALRVADRQKDDFLAMLAHELRNPLAAIASAAQVIRARVAHGESAERPLEVLERQVRNSARLLDDLLDVSRITRGALHLRKEPVRLDALVEGALDAQRSLIDAAGHHLEVTLPAEPVVLDADPTRLEQVISNLLNNAAKYTPPGGRIEVRVERREGEAVVRVRDTGSGIPPDLLPRVFDTFVQAQQPLARTRGGLGLGLALVRRLVEMHGGAVEARSAGAGEGSEFVVRLPAGEPEGQPAPPPAAPAPATARRILLVEDNYDAAELLAEFLESLGHRVVVAHDGPAALDAAERFDPEVALLDIGLPGMDGYEVGRRLRERPGGRLPVLIAITGYGQDEDRRRSRETGFAHHLTKPFEASVLERLVAEVPRLP